MGQEKDTIKNTVPQRYGLRVGFDAHRLAKSFYNSDYRGFEVVGDFRLLKDTYLAAELGNEKNTVNERNINYTNQGSYLKFGVDFNVYENWLNMENQIYSGLRVSYSTFSQAINSYNIYQENSYFPLSNFIDGNKSDGLSATWLEALFGLKAKFFNNVYFGASIRLNYLINQKEPSGQKNFFIPGFNTVTEDNKFGASFNYTISYFIPIFKKK